MVHGMMAYGQAQQNLFHLSILEENLIPYVSKQ